MAAGVPVVTSNTSSMPEVAGDAALLVDPADTAALAATLERALTDGGLRRRLIAAGRTARGVFLRHHGGVLQTSSIFDQRS